MEIIDKVNENKYVMKVVVLGDVNVGKSNIIRRILKQPFQELEATIGVEFAFIDVDNVNPQNPEQVISVQIWDTSGAERYRAITTNHIRNADGAYWVYDVTNQNSFDNIGFWLDLVKKSADEDIVIYLVGNKADWGITENRRKISKDVAIRYSKGKKFQGFGECSALKNINIEETFKSFCKTLFKKNKEQLDEKTKKKVIQLQNMKAQPKKDCC